MERSSGSVATKVLAIIIGDGQLEYYLSMKDVRGGILPRNGDSGSFEADKTERVPRAFQLVIVARGRAVMRLKAMSNASIARNRLFRG